MKYDGKIDLKNQLEWAWIGICVKFYVTMTEPYPAQADERPWVSELSFKDVFRRMAPFTVSYVDKSPKLTKAARWTLGQHPRHSPVITVKCYLKYKWKNPKYN